MKIEGKLAKELMGRIDQAANPEPIRAVAVPIDIQRAFERALDEACYRARLIRLAQMSGVYDTKLARMDEEDRRESGEENSHDDL